MATKCTDGDQSW